MACGNARVASGSRIGRDLLTAKLSLVIDKGASRVVGARDIEERLSFLNAKCTDEDLIHVDVITRKKAAKKNQFYQQ